MRKIIFCLIFLLSAICISAQTVRVRSGSFGKILVMRGKMRSAIDLSQNVAGCPYVPASYRRHLDKKGCTAPPATFKLIDAVTKNNQIFLVLEAEAMGNCNVCGQCGASEAFAVIWLKLDSRLRVLDKKSVPIEDCRANVSLLGDGVEFNEENQDETLTLRLKNDNLTIEFEKKTYEETTDGKPYEFSHLEYDRKTPEKGFVIKTEKRAESSAKAN